VPFLLIVGQFLRRTVAAVLIVSTLVFTATPAPAVGPRARGIAPSFNGSVYAIAHRGDVVYVGGDFTNATSGGHVQRRQRLAAFNARTGELLPWHPPADATVRALAVAGDSVYAAGSFHAVDGLPRDSLVRLQARTGEVRAFRHTLAGTPYVLATGNGRLYLGGGFTEVDGRPRANLAAFALDTGELDADWQPTADDTVHAVTVDGPRVYLGGGFHTVDEVTGSLRLAVVDGLSGAVDVRFRPRPPAGVRAIATDPGGIVVATAGVGGRAIAYTAGGTVRWQRVFDGDASAIASADGVTYVGGHFDSACLTSKNGAHGVCTDGSSPRYKLASVTSSGQLTDWAPQANGVIGVRVLTADPAAGTIEAGGDFTKIGGRDVHRFATFG
jgi:hypothetical protein